MTFIYDLSYALKASFFDVGVGLISFIPKLIGAVVIFLVGWLIAVVLGKLVAQIIKAIKLDVALRSAGFDKVVERGGFNLSSGGFIGALVKWFVIVVVLVASLDVLGLNAVTEFLRTDVLSYLPKVIIATLILWSLLSLHKLFRSLLLAAQKPLTYTLPIL